jgi:hypothetical protein
MRRRKKALKHGRVVPILVAAGVGYLIGSWQAAVVRSSEPSDVQTATQTVALRFPQALSKAPVVQAAAFERVGATHDALVMEHARLALFDPEPMLPASAPIAPAPAQPATPNAASEAPPEETADMSPTPTMQRSPETAAPNLPNPNELTSAAKTNPAAARRQAKRPGYLLNDAQIADIKRRLHLTPDQEQMWPAVAAALRNIGTEGEREARWRGTAGSINPDSPEVQDLKSAAIPLLMSFSDEQKDEVRDLAHHMGLDQLASEF